MKTITITELPIRFNDAVNYTDTSEGSYYKYCKMQDFLSTNSVENVFEVRQFIASVLRKTF